MKGEKFQDRICSGSSPIYVTVEGGSPSIVNPLDKRMMGCITTAEMLMGRDSYYMNYLKAYRVNQFKT
jgi:hypothetical protein